MFTLLIEPSTANDNRYDTTITVYKDDKQFEGFISHNTQAGSNEEFISKAQEFYSEINNTNTKIVMGV